MPKLPSISDIARTGANGQAAVAPPDIQAQHLQELGQEVQVSRRLLLDDILYDLGEAEQQEHLEFLITHHTMLLEHWRKAGRAFLTVGRALIKINEKLPKRTLDRLMNSFDKRESPDHPSALPFSRATAHRLMTFAGMVDDRRFERAFETHNRTFDETLLPAYSVTVAFYDLNPAQLAEAVERNLIRPDLPRSAALEFVSEFRRAEGASAAVREGEVRRVESRLRKLYVEVAKLEGVRATMYAAMGVNVARSPALVHRDPGAIVIEPVPSQPVREDEVRTAA